MTTRRELHRGCPARWESMKRKRWATSWRDAWDEIGAGLGSALRPGFADALRSAGITGLIVPDLPLDELAGLSAPGIEVACSRPRDAR